MTRQKTGKVLSFIVLWILSLLILIPMYMVVINSFKTKTEAADMNLQLPSQWHILDNYSQMIQEGGIGVGLRNSVIITLVCVSVVVITSSMAAFVIQRRKSKVSSVINSIFLVGIMLPIQIIPTVYFCKFLKMTSYLSAIATLIVANISVAVFLYTGFLKSIPRQLDESAILDGAGPLRLFFQIIFPLLKPVTATAIIVTFMSVWNDFGTSIYFLNSSKDYTITLTIYNFFGQHNSDWQLVFANVVVACIPVVLIYLFLQKYIISGMTAGSVKG